MELTGIAVYVGVLAGVAGVAGLARAIRVPPVIALLVLGLLLGRSGFDLISIPTLRAGRIGVDLHVAFLLGVVGQRLGEGMLRLPALTVLRRSLPPLALAAGSLLVGALVLPILLPDAEPQRSFYRFALPLAVVFGAFPLLAVRDLRGRPPEDVGSVFLVAVLLVGAVHSFTPQLLWAPRLDPSVVWRGPLLVLGESGTLGVVGGLVFLLLARRAGWPRLPVGLAVLLGLAWLAFYFRLWFPFTALGFGIALGRVRDEGFRLPGAGDWLYSELPFLLFAALCFAPDLFLESLVGPVLLHAIWLVVIVLAVRSRWPGGRALVTGPGLLFLGLTLTVRLDGRMGPLTRYAVDFALPAWVLLRLVMAGIERRRA